MLDLNEIKTQYEKISVEYDPDLVAQADAELVEFARKNIPALIAEIERLRDELNRKQPVCDCEFQSWVSDQYAEGR